MTSTSIETRVLHRALEIRGFLRTQDLVVPPLGERLAQRYRPDVVIPAGLFPIGLGFLLMKWGSNVVHASWLMMLPGCLISGIVQLRWLSESYLVFRSSKARLSVQQRCQQCTHTAPVRTLPVNPLAGVAAQEVRIEDANAWRHLRPGQFRADLV